MRARHRRRERFREPVECHPSCSCCPADARPCHPWQLGVLQYLKRLAAESKLRHPRATADAAAIGASAGVMLLTGGVASARRKCGGCAIR